MVGSNIRCGAESVFVEEMGACKREFMGNFSDVRIQL